MTLLNEFSRLRRTQRRIIARVKSLARPTDDDPNTPDSETEYKPLEWPVIRRMLQLMAPYKFRYAVGTTVAMTHSFLDMLGPLYIKRLIDHDIPGHPHFLTPPVAAALLSHPPAADAFLAAVGTHPSYWAIALTIGLWALTICMSLTLIRFNILFNRRTGESVVFALRRQIFAHLQRLSMSFYDRTKFGRIISRGTSDVDTIAFPIFEGINTVMLNLLSMGIAVTFLFVTSWRLALAVMWLGPVLYFLNRYYKLHIGQRWRVVREGYTRVSTNLAENINGVRVVTAYNRQDLNLDAFNDLQMTNTENNLAAAFLNGVYQPLLGVIGFLGNAIILVFGAYLLISSISPATTGPATAPAAAAALTVGTVVACYMYWGSFMGPVLNFGNFHNQLMMSMASAERIFALLDQQPDVTDAAQAAPLPPVRGSVVFDHVTFGYKPDTPVLHDICFEAKPGQTIALVGHTGCGKSTIINLICRFYQPQQGAVRIDGHDLKTITGESLHQQMGIVSQNNYLFSGTVLDNICYARPGATETQVVAAAKALGSHDILAALNDGYHTQVGERGASMSLGQRQLICFTRAFLANPRILMLDEATSAVDTHTEMLIQQALERLVADRTTFIVAHRLSTVKNANLVLVLNHGRIIERGTHGTLLELNGKYAELYKQFTRDL